ncbi:MAG: carbon-nitrogen hydrolase family protein [Gemmatimonadota bacterium]|nr:MAG: carbon-nitrogen hydrolase family protein [Gemmatimonadota bacterium]
MTSTPFTIAAVQAAPVFLNREATVQKACGLITQAAEGGAKLAVFPEAFIPAFPLWIWYIPPGKTHELRELYSELLANAISVPSEETDRLCLAAKEAEISVAIGINERNADASGTTLYDTILYIGADGRVLGKHRKLVPTTAERIVWGQGDGSTLTVVDLPIGRLGGLLCWENYMPLARYSMWAWGTQIFAAPTWDRGEPWISTMRHTAKEGRVYLVSCCSAMRTADIPDRYGFKHKYLSDAGEWLNPGLSLIVDPDGKVLAGPAENEETILYAEVEPEKLTGPRFQLDTAGHYARPDVFSLTVNRQERPMISTVEGVGECVEHVDD